LKLKILHINDLHSRYEKLAKISTGIKAIRDENTIILDAGDNADFARIETAGTNGRISSALLNEIGFHGRVFGNNEGFSGKEKGREISLSSDFPVTVCNLCDIDGSDIGYLEDSVIINVGNMRILLIGVTAPFNEFYILEGMLAKDPVEEVKRVLKGYNKEQYDIVILLSHLGLREDKEMANEIDDIDIIVGGHSHSLLETPIIINNTIICQAGNYGEYLGELDIEIDENTKEIKSHKGKLLDTETFDEDKAILKLITEYSEEANRNLSKPLYLIDKNLSHSLNKENEMGNLLADGLMNILETDIGIINSGVMNKGVNQGTVSKKLLLEICPSPLNPTYIELKGSDLLVTLEKSLVSDFQNADGKGSGFRGKWLGNIQISSNMRVEYFEDGKPFNKIKRVKINEETLDLEKWYTVATSDYLQRGTGYIELSNCKNEKYNPEYLRDTLEMYLQKEDFVNKSFEKRFISL